MDFSRRDTNEKNESSSVDDRKKGNHKKRKRSAKQIERCRKYRERLQKITDTGIHPGAGKQIDTDTGINHDKEGRDQQLRQHPVVPPFQIPALYIPGATAMHQPIYFFSPGMIPPAHVVGNTYISSSNTCNTTMLPSRQSDTDESRGQASEQGIARIPIEDSAGNAGSISSNERHNQDVISDITTAENESIDINSNDTDHNNPIPDDITSPDYNNDDYKNSDYDIFGIMTVFVNSHLHGVLSTDASMGNSSKDDKDFGYSYFCLANLLK